MDVIVSEEEGMTVYRQEVVLFGLCEVTWNLEIGRGSNWLEMVGFFAVSKSLPLFKHAVARARDSRVLHERGFVFKFNSLYVGKTSRFWRYSSCFQVTVPSGCSWQSKAIALKSYMSPDDHAISD